MSWLAPELNKRVQILTARLSPNEDGGGDLLFGTPTGGAFNSDEFNQLAPLLTVWMGMDTVGFKGTGTKYIRGEQVNEDITHEFKVRSIAVAQLGKQYSLGFSIAYKFMPNLVGLKSDYYLFVEQGSSVKGRLFRIHNVTDNKEQREYLRVTAEEVEERGVGWGV